MHSLQKTQRSGWKQCFDIYKYRAHSWKFWLGLNVAREDSRVQTDAGHTCSSLPDNHKGHLAVPFFYLHFRFVVRAAPQLI